MTPGEKALLAGVVIALGVAASRLAARLSVPALLLFLTVGMVFGSDVTGWIDFGDYGLAKTLGSFALALILFDGGLRAGWPVIRPVFRMSLSLAVVGTLVTAALTGLVAAPLLGISTLEGLLLGAVLSSTDGAAVFALLRGSKLSRRVERTLEGESGFNDPIAVLLVLVLIEAITAPDLAASAIVWKVVAELGFGAVIGLAVGRLGMSGLKRLHLESAGLYPVATFALAAISFGAADSVGGSGFLAIYVTGLLLGGFAMPARRTVLSFHDGLAWLAQVSLFLMLGLLVFPGRLGEIALEGAIITFVLVFLARPLATLVSLAPFRLPGREVFLIGWAGLRGAVPVVLATFVVVGGVPDATSTFDIVFFAVIFSTLIQGATVGPLAKRLGLVHDGATTPVDPPAAAALERLDAHLLTFTVTDGDAIAGRLVRELGLPRLALVNLVVRGDSAFPPRGATRIEVGDELHIIVGDEADDEMGELFVRWRSGQAAAVEPSNPR